MFDKINYNPDVLLSLANLSNDEVFTPPDIANQILDLLPKELWQDRNATFLDPVTKSGVFLREIVKRLMRGLGKEMPDIQERTNHILTRQVFGIAITELTSLLSRRSVYCSKGANSKYSICEVFSTTEGNIKFNRIEHTWQNGRCTFCGTNQEAYDRGNTLETHAYEFIHTTKPEDIFKMKFDVIIGNPPYQLSDGGNSASAIPLYHKFIEQAQKLNPRFLTMIVPSRWFSGGKGLDAFRSSMLHDKKIKILHDFINANECFPGVEIKGGVNYFLWERDYSGECEVNTHENGKISSTRKRPLLEDGVDVFIRYNKAISIFKKVQSFQEKSFSTIVSSRKPFGLPTSFKGKSNNFSNAIKIYQTKSIGYIKREEVLQNKLWIDQYKILLPKAIGSGDGRTDLIKPICSEPASCCNETYIVVGPLKSKNEAHNIVSYIRTKFFHFLVTLKKVTQDSTKKVYDFVPLQDFTEQWTDDKLYKKYGLTEEEIAFIDSMIRPMGDSNE